MGRYLAVRISSKSSWLRAIPMRGHEVRRVAAGSAIVAAAGDATTSALTDEPTFMTHQS